MGRFLFALFVVCFWSSTAFGEPPPLPDTHYGATLFRLAIVLVGVCTLAWASLRWGLRRYHPGSTGPVHVRARVPVEPRRSILLVEVGEKVFVVASTEHGMQSLGTMKAEDVPDVEIVEQPKFADVFARIRLGRDQKTAMEEEP